MTRITLQQSARTNGVLPYPFHVDAATGDIGRQDFWRGNPAAVIGFQRDADVHTIDLAWADAVADPQQAVGMFTVTVDSGGQFSVHLAAVATVTVHEESDR
jgi:hypothetical protein